MSGVTVLLQTPPTSSPARTPALPVRELLRELGGIAETVLLYHGDRGRPRAHRMLTEPTPVQAKLAQIFSLDRYAPRR